MDILSFITGIGPISAICFVLGLGLVIFEMFHPGLSFPGIMGGILLIAGVVLTARTLWDVIILLILILAILGVCLTVVVHSATRGHLSRVLILSESLSKEPRVSVFDELEYFVGKEGIALTSLRPAGTADFDGVRLDVISDGEFIPKDARIRIVRRDGRRIVVREIKD